MNKPYSRSDLIKEVSRKHGQETLRYLSERPSEGDIICPCCKCKTLRIFKERYGSGVPHYIDWLCEVWSGTCQRATCRKFYLWIEIMEPDDLERKNRELLLELCDRELKLLESNQEDKQKNDTTIRVIDSRAVNIASV